MSERSTIEYALKLAREATKAARYHAKQAKAELDHCKRVERDLREETQNDIDIISNLEQAVRDKETEIERLKAEAVQNDKAYDYELNERRACEARIEAALSWVKPHPRPVSDAQTIDRMVKALRGEEE